MSNAINDPRIADLFAHNANTPAASEDPVKRAIQVIRKHLGMDVAYVSEFVDDRIVFREVDAPGLEAMIKPGDSHSLDDVYCRHILAGTIPELMPDTSKVPEAVKLPITAALPIGSHISVPIRLADGECYGMFCCLSFDADQSLNGRDLSMMKAFSELASFEIDRNVQRERQIAIKTDRISEILNSGLIEIYHQPICDLSTREPIGFEALSRFSSSPTRSPDKWFAEADEVNQRVALEIAAIVKALPTLPMVPEDTYLSVNVSPETLLCSELADILSLSSLDRIVLEITEQMPIIDYDAINAALSPLRKQGMRLAVDDAGAGHASLKHIFQLNPDIIKFDMSLTRDLDKDPVRQVLIGALVSFCRDTDTTIVGEGVETEAELDALSKLGVTSGQGYLLGRPAPAAHHAAQPEERKLLSFA
ncbi:EAL domain-containing protein [Acuticoccus sp. MNP-M23]|uniref:sensor domain-containing phosphodiesterase n=1 Tax=Acuticoccus sp. MNP-M23 TaxID=3072793 RepID=UPI0028162781|nr:EAL domain-containing protein [Acuticoccus sp. MNP-M23]WMS42930.1 EAL domain-containing protein [Acuticoccus sp. MNP-M23]